MLDIESLRPFRPLISPNAVEYFSRILTPDSIVFESGSGTSTLWLAQHASKVISQEHNPDWADAIESALALDNLNNVELSLISEAEYGDDYVEAYANFILRFPNDSFHVVFVDGLDQARVSVITCARKKIKPGGWLVVDDSNWSEIALCLNQFNSWPHATFCGWKEGAIDGHARYGCTTFHRKPLEARVRVGVVSNWADSSQVCATREFCELCNRSWRSPNLFFLILKGDPLDTTLSLLSSALQVTWADFKKGTKLFSCDPISWARELGLDWVLYAGSERGSWMDELEAVGFHTGLLKDWKSNGNK